MLNISKEKPLSKITEEDLKKGRKDIIVEEATFEITSDEEGNEIKKRNVKKINITKKINETAKLINEVNAEERLRKIKEAIQGEN